MGYKQIEVLRSHLCNISGDLELDLGRKNLEFNPKMEEQWDKAAKILNDVDWDYSKLTAEDTLFFKQIGDIDYEEIGAGYYNSGPIGCSWYCGGWVADITASSYLKSRDSTINYLPTNAHNWSFKTAWIEGVKGYGIGEYITYHFQWNNPRITRIFIANGYVKSEKTYRENSRVKKLKMYINDEPFAILNLEDRRVVQYFEFEPIGRMGYDEFILLDWEESEKLPYWTMKFEILEVYKGDK